MKLRFTIRDLLWLTVVAALAVGWLVYAYVSPSKQDLQLERTKLNMERARLQLERIVWKLEKPLVDPDRAKNNSEPKQDE